MNILFNVLVVAAIVALLASTLSNYLELPIVTYNSSGECISVTQFTSQDNNYSCENLPTKYITEYTK